MIKPVAILPLIALCLAAGTATATAVEPTDAGWAEVARVRNGGCALSVTGNGQYYRIAASGLGSGALGRMVLANGDMKPLDWAIRATGDGGLARYYLPFRWHHDGGEVTIAVQSVRCSVSTRFAWRRAEVTVR